jgi:hypothetical protein
MLMGLETQRLYRICSFWNRRFGIRAIECTQSDELDT